MNTNEQIVEDLTIALQMGLSAAHQYRLYAPVPEDWGRARLAEQMRGEMT